MLLESELVRDLANSVLINGLQHYIFGDTAYAIWTLMIKSLKNTCFTEAQRYFNKRMSEISVFVEDAFKDIKQYFTHIDFVQKGKISVTPFELRYYAAAILWNFMVSLYGSITASNFDYEPSALEGYASAEE